MPAPFTPRRSVQVWDFEAIGLLIQSCRLVCGFCSSRQRFACGFLQIPPRGGHPCRLANDSPCRVRRGLSPPSDCAMPGAPKKERRTLRSSPLCICRAESRHNRMARTCFGYARQTLIARQQTNRGSGANGFRSEQYKNLALFRFRFAQQVNDVVVFSAAGKVGSRKTVFIFLADAGPFVEQRFNDFGVAEVSRRRSSWG